MNLLPIISILTGLVISIFLIEYIFSEDEKNNFEPKTKLDVPLGENIILILASSNCVFCNNLFEYIDSLNDNLNPDLNIVVVKYEKDGLNYNDKYSKLSDIEKDKIDDIIEYNKNNPNFGFPTVYKNDIIQVGFDKDKLSNFFLK